jgi:hypothetical protein
MGEGVGGGACAIRAREGRAPRQRPPRTARRARSPRAQVAQSRCRPAPCPGAPAANHPRIEHWRVSTHLQLRLRTRRVRAPPAESRRPPRPPRPSSPRGGAAARPPPRPFEPLPGTPGAGKMTMNIFRIAGDMSHLASFFFLAQRLLESKKADGEAADCGCRFATHTAGVLWARVPCPRRPASSAPRPSPSPCVPPLLQAFPCGRRSCTSSCSSRGTWTGRPTPGPSSPASRGRRRASARRTTTSPSRRTSCS